MPLYLETIKGDYYLDKERIKSRILAAYDMWKAFLNDTSPREQWQTAEQQDDEKRVAILSQKMAINFYMSKMGVAEDLIKDVECAQEVCKLNFSVETARAVKQMVTMQQEFGLQIQAEKWDQAVKAKLSKEMKELVLHQKINEKT